MYLPISLPTTHRRISPVRANSHLDLVINTYPLHLTCIRSLAGRNPYSTSNAGALRSD